MTKFHAYDELTWPEVRSLQRNTPIVLPIGGGYSMERVAEALNNPPEIYLLPNFPYGWIGSGLPVPEQVLEKYLSNLIAGLQDDGFINTLIVIPPGINLSLSTSWIALPQERAECNKFFLPPDEDRGKVVLIPVGHTEQHGYHLPLSTDTLIIDAIAQGTAEAHWIMLLCYQSCHMGSALTDHLLLAL